MVQFAQSVGRLAGLIIALSLFWQGGGWAAPNDDEPSLDELFLELQDSQNMLMIQSLQGQILKRLRAADSDSVKLLMQRGDGAMIERDYDRALRHYSDVVAFRPDFAGAWFARAQALRRMNRFTEAILDIERAVTLEPRYFTAWEMLGDIFLELDNSTGAYKAFKKALEANPHLEDAERAVEYLRREVEGRGI